MIDRRSGFDRNDSGLDGLVEGQLLNKCDSVLEIERVHRELHKVLQSVQLDVGTR